LETLLHELVRGLFECKMKNAECRILHPNALVNSRWTLHNGRYKEQGMSAMKERDLQLRTKQFALDVISFCECLPKDEASRILSRQLLRSGTSVGANYRAACRAKSKPAFISKMGDVLEEADESGYWVELLTQSGKVDSAIAAPVLTEANELVAIVISSINTAKRNSDAGNPPL
jgi:four helix bundle protein